MSGGNFEFLYKACSIFTYTGPNERGEIEWQIENDSEMNTVSEVKGPEFRQELVQTD